MAAAGAFEAEGRAVGELDLGQQAADESMVQPVVTAVMESLMGFQGIARRLQPVAKLPQCHIYDDYAHHPTEVGAAASPPSPARHVFSFTHIARAELVRRCVCSASRGFQCTRRPTLRLFVTRSARNRLDAVPRLSSRGGTSVGRLPQLVTMLVAVGVDDGSSKSLLR